MNYDAKVTILGGGVTGLCAAHYAGELFGRGSVLLLESSDVLGGTTRTDTIDGFKLDWGPNGFLDREPLTLKWVEDLGIGPDLIRANEAAAKRFIMKHGRLVQIQGPPQFMFSPLLSVRGRLRLLREPFVARKTDSSPETIWNFAARRIGPEAADTLVSCMVSGVFGGDAKQLSLEHCFPRMAAMEREFGSLFKALMAKKKQNKGASPMGPGGTLTSFAGGIGFLPEHAGKLLGDRALTRNGAKRVLRETSGYRIETENGDTVETEHIVVAMPTYAAARVLRELDEALAASLDSVAYADIAVICTGYRREQIGHDLDGFGFLVPRSEGKRVLGCLWTSSIFPHESADGHVLLRTMIGGYTDPGAVALSDGELLEYVRKEIHPLMGATGEPELVRVFRHTRGIPQYLIGHADFLRKIEAAQERHGGLVFAGNAYRGVGLNDCVVSALRALEGLAAG